MCCAQARKPHCGSVEPSVTTRPFNVPLTSTWSVQVSYGRIHRLMDSYCYLNVDMMVEATI